MTSTERDNKPDNGELFAQFFNAQITEPEPEPTEPATDDFRRFFGIN